MNARCNLFKAAGIVILVCAVPQGAKAELWGTSGGWNIFAEEGYCAVAQEFEGDGATELGLALYSAGHVGMLLQNSNWSVEQEQKYDISYWIGGIVFEGSPSIGQKNAAAKPGFIAMFERDFADAFAAGKNIIIKMGDVTVDQLSLDGSAGAIAKARVCLRSIEAKQRAADAERKRLEHIAKDPFKAESVKRSANLPPIPVNSIGAWATTNDYPSAALRDGREGEVEYELTVSANGKVTKCEIITSSGHSDLDSATCSVALRRARFNSATDSNGQPVEDTHMQKTRWKIPR